jgi:hypothetical protein
MNQYIIFCLKSKFNDGSKDSGLLVSSYQLPDTGFQFQKVSDYGKNPWEMAGWE